MPSYRYLRDIQPEDNQTPPPPEYTPRDKAKNWWHYHWKLLVVILLFIAAGAWFLADILSRVHPDITIGIVSPYALPEELTERLEAQLSPYAQDVNNDGKTVVEIETYVLSASSGSEELPADAYQQMAGTTRLSTALSNGATTLFLVSSDELEAYQQNYNLFGPQPTLLRWADSPLLTSLDLRLPAADGSVLDAQPLLANYYIGLRPFALSALSGKKDGQAQWQAAEALFAHLAAG